MIIFVIKITQSNKYHARVQFHQVLNYAKGWLYNKHLIQDKLFSLRIFYIQGIHEICIPTKYQEAYHTNYSYK